MSQPYDEQLEGAPEGETPPDAVDTADVEDGLPEVDAALAENPDAAPEPDVDTEAAADSETVPDADVFTEPAAAPAEEAEAPAEEKGGFRAKPKAKHNK